MAALISNMLPSVTVTSNADILKKKRDISKVLLSKILFMK
jgi:hypothetical protein